MKKFAIFLGFTLLLSLSFVYAGQEIPIKATDAIIPFHSVNGILPGFSKYSEVRKILGVPDEIEQPKKKDVAGVTIGEVRVFHYKKKGISVVFSSERAADPVVEAIYVEYPYKGRTPTGLFIGIDKGEAISIINQNYHVTMVLGNGEAMFIAKGKDHEDSFQVWFENGILVKMKLFR